MSTLYTIGHSNGGIEPFNSVLREHGVTLLADVRSRPRSRFAHFNGRALSQSLRDASIEYIYMGDQLGGMPRDPAWSEKWKQGRIDPDVIAHLRDQVHWREGIDRLGTLVMSTKNAVCIMCSERDPSNCHRSAVAEDVAATVPALQIAHLGAARPATQQRLL